MPELPIPVATSLYAVRIPQLLVHLLTEETDDKKIIPSNFTNLRYLETLLPLEDVFYFTYEQSNPSFTEFCIRYHVPSILTLSDNVEWLSEVKTKYDLYIQKRKDMEKVNQQSENGLTPPISLPSILSTHNYAALVPGENNVIVFTESAEGANVVEMKQRMHSDIYDRLGYDTLRRHPIFRFLLVDAL